MWARPERNSNVANEIFKSDFQIVTKFVQIFKLMSRNISETDPI